MENINEIMERVGTPTLKAIAAVFESPKRVKGMTRRFTTGTPLLVSSSVVLMPKRDSLPSKTLSRLLSKRTKSSKRPMAAEAPTRVLLVLPRSKSTEL